MTDTTVNGRKDEEKKNDNTDNRQKSRRKGDWRKGGAQKR